MAGVRPRCSIIPERLFSECDGPVPMSRVASSLYFAAAMNAWVVNASWGIESDAVVPDMEAALTNFLTNSRSGRGGIVVVAMGADWLGGGSLTWPATNDSCLSVNGMKLGGSYDALVSVTSPHTDLAAPQRPADNETLVSLDRMGDNGYIDSQNTCIDGSQSYTCSFYGTSAAAPLVTGCVALLLSEDSLLTTGQVDSVLKASAVKELKTDSLDIWEHSHQFGYGRVNAVRALSALCRERVNIFV